MKTLALVCSILVSTALVLVLMLRTDRVEPAPVGSDAFAARAASIDARLDDIVRRMDALERRSSSAVVVEPDQERATARNETPAVPVPSEARPRDAAWYLEQYVASFDAGGEGSEYFRLIVDAYIAELVEPVCGLVLDSRHPIGLRLGLVRMFGKARFREDGRVLDVLVHVVRSGEAESSALAALDAWTRIGDRNSSQRLEAIVWKLESSAVIQAALRALLAVAGDRSNQVLVRLLYLAPDDASAKLLVEFLDGAELEAALAFFQRAAQLAQPVRLAAAHKIGSFTQPEFLRFVEDWLRVETDPDVITALGGAREQQRQIAGWSPMQAIGAPDADKKRNDSRAWAPRDPEMGAQWLQLDYASADRINGVNVHETCTAGALAEVRARDLNGEWHVLWSGQASSGLEGPLEIRFSPTSFRTQTLRLVLDTNRTSGWNEIDAVEFFGLGGNQWATGASASSTYAQRGVGGKAFGFGARGLLIEGR